MLSTIISRIRGTSHAVPLIAAYDDHERLWLPPAPVLFQRRIGAENRAIPAATIRKILTAALARTGLTGPAGNPLHYTPHDFRRMFLTDAKMSGVASAASFGGSSERALPAVQPAALEQARSHGSPCTLRDLGCHLPLASSRTMMQPVRLQRIPA